MSTYVQILILNPQFCQSRRVMFTRKCGPIHSRRGETTIAMDSASCNQKMCFFGHSCFQATTSSDIARAHIPARAPLGPRRRERHRNLVASKICGQVFLATSDQKQSRTLREVGGSQQHLHCVIGSGTVPSRRRLSMYAAPPASAFSLSAAYVQGISKRWAPGCVKIR